MAARTFRSESGSESVSSAALDGAGAIGDLTGITTMRSTIAAGTTPAAARFMTGTTSTEAAETVEEDSTGPAEGPGPGLSTAIAGLPEDMPNHGVRAASAQARLAATAAAGKQEAFPRAEAPASVAEVFTAGAAVAGIDARSLVRLLVLREIKDGEKPHGTYKTELR